jgi:uncharacterized integral membrane protein
MRSALWVIAGAILVIVGAVWIGQGSGAVKGSFMTGRTNWELIGIVAVVLGVLVLAGGYVSHRRHRARRHR